MRAILFDLDGVIINSEFVVKAAFTLSYRQAISNGEPPVEEYIKNMGNSFKNIMKKLSLPIEIEEPFKLYSRQMGNLINLHKGIEELLNILASRNIKMAIVTGKDGMRTREILNNLKIDSYFDIVVAGDEVEYPKPSPEAIYKALNYLQLSPDEVIFVGDSPNDIISAKSAGVRSCAVTWGFTSKEELVKEKPHYIVDNALEILQFLSEDKQKVSL